MKKTILVFLTIGTLLFTSGGEVNANGSPCPGNTVAKPAKWIDINGIWRLHCPYLWFPNAYCCQPSYM